MSLTRIVCVCGCVAVVLSSDCETRSGAYNFRKSWKHYEECVELIKTLSEKSPYFTNLACSLNVGIGFFHFFISGTSPRLSSRPVVIVVIVPTAKRF